MSPRQIAVEILIRIRKDDAFADILIHNEFSKHDLSNLDKSFISALVHGTLRWQGKLDWLIEQFYRGSFKKCPAAITAILETALYQILQMSKTPEFAAVNEAVRLAQKRKGRYWGNRVNAILRNYLRKKDTIKFPDLKIDPVEAIAVRYSHPRWLVKRWIARYGTEETGLLCAANNKIPDLSLRINPLKTTRADLIRELKANGVSIKSDAVPDGFIKTNPSINLTTLPSFQKGYFTIQDISAGLVGLLSDPSPGETIIDLCAAPGGKTTHLAELARGQCTIIANDCNWQRLNLIRQNIERLQLPNIYLVRADAAGFSARPVDKVLLDAPCSGLGVLAKRSDLRWKRTLKDIQNLSLLQTQLIEKAAGLVKPGGYLVYSTCTIEPDENEMIIEKFLKKYSEFAFARPPACIPENFISNTYFIKTLPHKHQIDGSFAVKLVRNK